jgi:hypothetical protein
MRDWGIPAALYAMLICVILGWSSLACRPIVAGSSSE